MKKMNRRNFLKITTAGVASASAFSAVPIFGQTPKKLRMAQIGIAGRGRDHIGWVRGNNDFVVACDVDSKILNMYNIPFRKYIDYRKMFENEMDNIDAVVISTPDHIHFPIAMTALANRKAVFCEKPLTWSVDESLALARMAEKMKVPTQMGNQGNGRKGWRECHAIINNDEIGKVLEVHTWTNRPRWPQGRERPDPATQGPCPDTLDWDVYCAVAPHRPYQDEVHPFKWRGIRDFGTGAFGDMACHTTNAMHQILKPDFDVTVEPIKIEGATEDQYPSRQIIKSIFAQTDTCPGFVSYWYDGNLKPEKPEALGENHLPGTGCMFIGTKGVLISEGDYNNRNSIYRNGERLAPGNVELIIPAGPAITDEFLAAARGEREWNDTISNFQYSSKMTAITNMAIIAEKLNRKITFSKKTMKFDDAEANQMMHRKPREGWELGYEHI